MNEQIQKEIKTNNENLKNSKMEVKIHLSQDTISVWVYAQCVAGEETNTLMTDSQREKFTILTDQKQLLIGQNNIQVTHLKDESQSHIKVTSCD